MIARIWHGRVPANQADVYHAYLVRTGLADYAITPGNLGIQVLRRLDGDVAHFLLTTFWDSLESIRAFTGPDYAKARYYPEDSNYLLELEPFVTHYEVLAMSHKPKADKEPAK